MVKELNRLEALEATGLEAVDDIRPGISRTEDTFDILVSRTKGSLSPSIFGKSDNIVGIVLRPSDPFAAGAKGTKASSQIDIELLRALGLSAPTVEGARVMVYKTKHTRILTVPHTYDETPADQRYITAYPLFYYNPSIFPLVPGSMISGRFDIGTYQTGIITGMSEEGTYVLPPPDPNGPLSSRNFSSAGTGADPGSCPWSNHRKQRTDTWQSTDPRYSEWNGTEIRNGSLEKTGMLRSDSASGVLALPPVMEDFRNFAAAYKVKFGKQLRGSGYRTYDSQVEVRMLRAGPGHYCGQGSARLHATGRMIGKAATPGTSNHGWGSAVDLDRSDWTGGKGNNSPEFRWLNKFSENYNFVFNVTNEHWHITWKNIKTVLPGMRAPGVAWNPSGRNDPNITLV